MLSVYNFMFPGGMGGGGGMALNQLLVVMDGIDNPPFFRRVITNRTNTLLDAIYVVPRRIKNRSARLPAPRPRKEQIYFIGATNVPIDRLDPALIRPGRMGRHVWFRTPTKKDRLDILDLYINKVKHSEDLDRPERRDEIARIMSGYSPAMIDQATSLALTIAHHSGRTDFNWDDLIEAVTTLDAGTAIGVDYIPRDRRAVAVHEAGHAVAGHVYMRDRESTRLTIKMRGDTGGHHWMVEREERFGFNKFQSDFSNEIIWGLGAMAAERVFYGENSAGVGGDVYHVTAEAAQMVGGAAMGPLPFDVTPLEGETEEMARERVLERFSKIGLQIMNRFSGGGPMDPNPIGAALGDPTKRAMASQIIGQAYVTAHVPRRCTTSTPSSRSLTPWRRSARSWATIFSRCSSPPRSGRRRSISTTRASGLRCRSPRDLADRNSRRRGRPHERTTGSVRSPLTTFRDSGSAEPA